VQGILLDLDGSLINNRTLPAALFPPAGSGGPVSGPGATLHSAIGNLLYGAADCVYYNGTDGTVVDTSSLPAIVPGGPASPADSMWCSPSVVFRRAQLTAILPASTAPFYVVDVATNRSSLVPGVFTTSVEDGGGWQFTLAAQREYLFFLAVANRTDLMTYM
jgi:hypothetical protein